MSPKSLLSCTECSFPFSISSQEWKLISQPNQVQRTFFKNSSHPRYASLRWRLKTMLTMLSCRLAADEWWGSMEQQGCPLDLLGGFGGTHTASLGFRGLCQPVSTPPSPGVWSSCIRILQEASRLYHQVVQCIWLESGRGSIHFESIYRSLWVFPYTFL